ncbi:hypothetical protein BVV10_20740 [Xanthomonas oryzae pv. oryzae]|nr:hypothetical protein BVV16_20745 [Xanthomonas oryzae pv. oryzae]AUI95654.1 hypothetical protein BVV17_20775 [Xanthomonas oryzae pv. oryzae]AUI99325.1 hypothetical protein BVV18_20775 [Xanthomonas oryzae pv. oryzae]AUJ03002.1 hypothetical protein BVV10_20740 [Xanthomonas oryzae pv. oryzae]AUJ06667.1 hypothetical protein BVV19_20820 [Xanthomonas oryzae pv. oryzae]
MGENCQKPGRSVTKTGNSSTPITQMKPCNGCGLGVFQGRRHRSPVAVRYQGRATRGSLKIQVQHMI